MYFVSGCNLFGQWFSKDHILFGFQNISVSEKVNEFFNHTPKKVKLLEVKWSYNIFQIDDGFYISGSWLGQENQFLKFDLPEDCRQCIKGNELKDITIIGNDYNLILLNQNTYVIWIINLEKESVIKKVRLNIDVVYQNTIDLKRIRIDDKIIKAITTNDKNCLYLTENGIMYSGSETFIILNFSFKNSSSGRPCDIASGYDHFMMLTDTGEVYTWGNGRRLQLGHGDLTNLQLPVQVQALAGIKITKISAGGWHSLALSESGDLYAWGWNDVGQLGVKIEPEDPVGVLKTEGLKSYPQPTLVELFDENDQEVTLNIIDIACGARHSAILLEDNTVWTSGNNKYGQLGFSPDEHATVNYFKKSFQCTDKVKLKCGLWTTVLITDDDNDGKLK